MSQPNLVPGGTNGRFDAFVRDLRTGRNTVVSRSSSGELGNSDSSNGPLTPDAHHILYTSYSTNLVPDDTTDQFDVFVTDRRG